MFNLINKSERLWSCKTVYSAFSEDKLDIRECYLDKLLSDGNEKYSVEDIQNKPCIRLFVSNNYVSAADNTYYAWLICDSLTEANNILLNASKTGYLEVNADDIFIVDYDSLTII